MARRRKIVLNPKLLSRLSEKIRSNALKNVDESGLELQSWSDLPSEILELVMAFLPTEDNFSASEVCRKWNLAAMSVRIPSPLIMLYPKSEGGLYEFHDVRRRKSLYLNIPELSDSAMYCCQHGWLLLYKKGGQHFFFFNPFNWELINLPPNDYPVTNATRLTFSAPPTSPNCVVCSLVPFSSSEVKISTYRFGGVAQWSTTLYATYSNFSSPGWNNISFCRGLFYCIDRSGFIWAFDPERFTLDTIDIGSAGRFDLYGPRWESVKHMAEHEGAIYIVVPTSKRRLKLFKVNVIDQPSVEVADIRGMTLFAGLVSSYFKADGCRFLKNTVYFSKIRSRGKRCIKYSFNERRYYPKRRGYDWDSEDPREAVWIQPPRDLSDFIRRAEYAQEF